MTDFEQEPESEPEMFELEDARELEDSFEVVDLEVPEDEKNENDAPEIELKEFDPKEPMDNKIRKYTMNQDTKEVEVEYVDQSIVLDKYIDFCNSAIASGKLNFRLDCASPELTEFNNRFYASLV